MKLLLDAHALLWWLADDAGLDVTARGLIADPGNEVLVGAGTVWEIEIKRALGKLDAPPGLVDAISEAGFLEVPILGIDSALAASLPPHHRDPFDRMLVAQSRRLDATVVTRDQVFTAYGTRTVPA